MPLLFHQTPQMYTSPPLDDTLHLYCTPVLYICTVHLYCTGLYTCNKLHNRTVLYCTHVLYCTLVLYVTVHNHQTSLRCPPPHPWLSLFTSLSKVRTDFWEERFHDQVYLLKMVCDLRRMKYFVYLSSNFSIWHKDTTYLCFFLNICQALFGVK